MAGRWLHTRKEGETRFPSLPSPLPACRFDSLVLSIWMHPNNYISAHVPPPSHDPLPAPFRPIIYLLAIVHNIHTYSPGTKLYRKKKKKDGSTKGRKEKKKRKKNTHTHKKIQLNMCQCNMRSTW